MKKIRSLLPVLLCAGLMTGCTGVEAEKRLYPQVISIDDAEGQYEVILGLPDMSKATGQDKSTEGENPNSLVFKGKNEEEIMEKYNRTQEKYLDGSHVDIIILGKTICNTEKWRQVLTSLSDQVSIGEDIYVLRASDPGEVMEQNGGKMGSLGDYLVGLYENRPEGESIKGVTLRKVLKVWYEQDTLTSLPLVQVTEEKSIYVEDREETREGAREENACITAWWGTMYPQYCYSQIEDNQDKKAEIRFRFRWLHGF